MKRTIVVALIGFLAARPALAQVGFEPAQSPYRDVEFRQGVTAFAGWYNAALDPAGVAPRSGPMAGLRYDVGLIGPAQLVVRSAYVLSERNVIDPRQPPTTRLLRRSDSPLLVNDLGIAVNLTGERSWHRVVPLVQFGGGAVTDLRPVADIGNYRFGTTFALSLGAGVRFVPGGRWEYRADVTDHLYSIRYPTSYFQSTSSNTFAPVLGSDRSRSSWRHNAALTVGITYRFLR